MSTAVQYASHPFLYEIFTHHFCILTKEIEYLARLTHFHLFIELVRAGQQATYPTKNEHTGCITFTPALHSIASTHRPLPILPQSVYTEHEADRRGMHQQKLQGRSLRSASLRLRMVDWAAKQEITLNVSQRDRTVSHHCTSLDEPFRSSMSATSN